ncbi:(2Fe-2S)-binding protein [Aquamicrobium terrae]|uniref:Molibdopterin-dependent oxidoreductase YjgC n=1 Tax=Aquamicrobium terrae TaxID=1324945 RepID=A0ABV2N1F6_9HYPH
MLFRRLDEKRASAIITFDGKPLAAFEGESVAACLLRHGVGFTRLTPSGAKRAPYCLMGACFECTMTVDGHTNVQICLTRIRDGMVVERSSDI